MALVLACPWVELTGLGLDLGLEESGIGLGLGTCGLVNIPGIYYEQPMDDIKCW